jgi:type IV secretory pathway VirB4 component
MADVKKYTGPRTQDFIPVREIRDGIIVLEDGSLRAILLASAINIALKSADEQQAIVMQFQGFLNSIEFPVQISIQSRRHDIKPYLLTLERRIEQQEEELLRLQTQEYIEFIRWFTDSVNIMSKKFYVVVPYSGGAFSGSQKKGGGVFGGIFSSKKKGSSFRESSSKFEEQRSQLEQRVAIVKGGLSRFGVRSEQLNTEQAIEVFYNMFNPGENHRNIPKLEQ